MRGPCGTWLGGAAVCRRALLLTLLLAIAMGTFLVPVAGAAPAGEVRLLTIEGVINPITARYLDRELRDAAAARAGVVIVRLNTPGGLESSMREMTQAMLGSPVPVVVFVAPSGARAASAGMFITLAAHVAAMAPGTNIGAAHPVGLGGETDPAMAEKLVNDAAALARSISVTRGRNAAWAEQAVRESASITAEEALDQGVIDLVVGDLEGLLDRLAGRPVQTAAGTATLQTVGAPVVEHPMSLPERILQTIADPNIAYILFTIGVIGIIAELYNPGSLFPGLTGAISLILAFVAFGSLPVSWAGVLLLLLAVGLFVAELYTEGVGILAVAGLIAFVLGSLMLYTPLVPTSPAMPDVRVSPWLVAMMAATFAGFFLLVFRALLTARQAPVVAGAEALSGRIGVAVTDLAPAGRVRVDSEDWSAVAEGGPIRAGEKVQVVGVSGVTLRVKKP
ncbi:MAG: nodulation protein NfeD [Chloroflexi bacterium]|nr:nodulation protein NfeD [Chloroflexota bacterium]